MASTQTEQIAELIEESSALNQTFQGKKEEIDKAILEMKKLESERNVNFSANYFYWGATPNTTFKSALTYPTVEQNNGGMFNSDTGIFTAPSNGVYLFAATVAVSTVVAIENADGSDINYLLQGKWHEDMQFHINKSSVDGSEAKKIAEIWIGEGSAVGPDKLRPLWFRTTGSTQVITSLKKGEKVSFEFTIWNDAKIGDKLSTSHSFCGAKIV